MKQKTGVLLSILLITLWIAVPSAFAQEAYKIGLILATTGAYAGMGMEDKLGATLAAKRINEAGGINGHKIELIFEDDEGDAGKGATAIRKVISVDKVSAIFGSTSNIVSHSISVLAEEMKVPMIAPVPSVKVSQGKKFVFQNVVKEESSVEFMGQYIERIRKWKKVGILNDGTEYGMDLSTMLEKWLQGKNIPFVTEKFSPRATDVSPQWMSIRRANVDGVVLVGGPPTGPAVAMKNRKQMGITTPVLGPSSLNAKKFLELVEDAGEGMVLVSYFRYGKWPADQASFISYINKNNPDVFPTLHHALGWDAVNLFAFVMKKVGNDPLKIRDELEKTTKYQGVAGEYNFSPTRHDPLSIQSLTYVKIQNGKFVAAEE